MKKVSDSDSEGRFPIAQESETEIDNFQQHRNAYLDDEFDATETIVNTFKTSNHPLDRQRIQSAGDLLQRHYAGNNIRTSAVEAPSVPEAVSPGAKESPMHRSQSKQILLAPE